MKLNSSKSVLCTLWYKIKTKQKIMLRMVWGLSHSTCARRGGRGNRGSLHLYNYKGKYSWYVHTMWMTLVWIKRICVSLWKTKTKLFQVKKEAGGGLPNIIIHLVILQNTSCQPPRGPKLILFKGLDLYIYLFITLTKFLVYQNYKKRKTVWSLSILTQTKFMSSWNLA